MRFGNWNDVDARATQPYMRNNGNVHRAAAAATG
jgi:hypothetical protein